MTVCIKEHVENIHVQVVDLEAVIKEADFITFHVPDKINLSHDKQRTH